MYVKTGQYTGNGSSQSISGLGFQPKFVFIKGGANVAVICTDTMGTDNTKPASGASALFNGGVTSLDAGGFSVGSDSRVNANTTVYRWLACAPDGTNLDFETGSYTGNATDNRDINLSVITGTPDMVWIASAGAETVYSRTSTYTGDLGQNLDTNQALNNTIQSFSAGKFQIGNRANTINTSSTVYHYVVWRAQANVFKNITYTGNGSDDRNITGMGFQGDFVATKRENSSNELVVRFSTESGDASYPISGLNEQTDHIQAIQSDGFQVGTSARVNIATGTPNYHAFGFRDNPQPASAVGPLVGGKLTKSILLRGGRLVP